MSLKSQSIRKFTDEEHQTWQTLFAQLEFSRQNQIIPQFKFGLETLGITGEGIPDLDEVNARLEGLTGWRGVPVEGLEDAGSFYPALAEKRFPIGNFIRSAKDLAYTPEPDIFHDLYGHIPFYVDPDYADFCQKYGELASRYASQPDKIRKFERLFWFSVEFGLVETEHGRRIFGAGIVSSQQECNYSLGPDPEVVEFDLETIANQQYRIDILQQRLFVLRNSQQLYSCLEDFETLL